MTGIKHRWVLTTGTERREDMACKNCGSYAINPHLHGRTDDVDLNLCDVCYWRTRAEVGDSVRTEIERAIWRQHERVMVIRNSAHRPNVKKLRTNISRVINTATDANPSDVLMALSAELARRINDTEQAGAVAGIVRSLFESVKPRRRNAPTTTLKAVP